jgi:hypothetical protein
MTAVTLARRTFPWSTVAIGGLLGLLAAETLLFIQVIERSPTTFLGMDYLFYRDLGAQWLETGQWYLPFQFGPHEFTAMVDNVYPPTALVLFVPAAVAPWIAWWGVPIALLGAALWRMRPAPWAWVAILILLMWPRSIGGYLYGNTTMWTTAGLAAGLVAVASLPMLPLWFDYVTVIRNQSSVGVWALIGDIPPMLIPMVAWLSRSRLADSRS